MMRTPCARNHFNAAPICDEKTSASCGSAKPRGESREPGADERGVIQHVLEVVGRADLHGAVVVGREVAGEETALSAHLDGFLVEVVHELVDEREGDELDLIGGQRELADEDIAAGVDAAFGFGGEH